MNNSGHHPMTTNPNTLDSLALALQSIRTRLLRLEADMALMCPSAKLEPQPQPEFTVPATLPHQLNSGWIDTKLPPQPQPEFTVPATLHVQKGECKPERGDETPQTLIDAVNNLIELVPQIKCVNIYDVEQFGIRVNAIKQALAREKKRQELVDAVIQATRAQMQRLLEPGAMDVPCGCPTCGAIDALDTFDKGGE